MDKAVADFLVREKFQKFTHQMMGLTQASYCGDASSNSLNLSHNYGFNIQIIVQAQKGSFQIFINI